MRPDIRNLARQSAGKAPLPGVPPPELAHGFAVAAAACQRLETAGMRLHFAPQPSGRHLVVEVHDAAGAVWTISGSDALRLAGGWPVLSIPEDPAH